MEQLIRYWKCRKTVGSYKTIPDDCLLSFRNFFIIYELVLFVMGQFLDVCTPLNSVYFSLHESSVKNDISIMVTYYPNTLQVTSAMHDDGPGKFES